MMNYLGTTGNPLLRTVAEGPIIEFLLLGGWAYELREGERQAATAATRKALAGWLKAGLPAAVGVDGQPRYDPVEVLNFMKSSSLDRDDGFWADRYLTTGRRLVLDHRANQVAPGQFAGLGTENVSVVLTRRFNLSSVAPRTRLRLRLPLPVEDATLRDLQLKISADCAAQVEYRQSPGRLEARFAAPATDLVDITYRADFRLDPRSAGVNEHPSEEGEPLDAAALELYTRPSEGLIRVTPRIIALAQELAALRRDSREMISSFWDYLMDHLRCGAVHYDEIDQNRPMDWVLDHGWYDCLVGSALLVSLCRAQQIPARIINGYLLYPLAPTNHYWAEIWFEGSGWTPFDLLSWDLSGGGRDRSWRNCFAGTLDYRMKTQCFPRTVIGPIGLHLPPQWHILTQAISGGIRITLADSQSGAVAYSDDVSVRFGGSQP